MNETLPPKGGSRWRSCLGCTGCATVVAFFLILGLYGFAIGLSPAIGRLNPSPVLEAGGVALRVVFDLSPPSTKPPAASAATTDSADWKSPEEAAYFEQYDWYRIWMLQSEDRLRYLQIFSSVWSSRWKSQLAAEAQSWHQLSLQVQQIDPPAGDESINEGLLAAFDQYATAADDVERFVQTGDQGAFDASKDALKQGDALIEQSQMIIAGGGSSLGPGGSDKTMTAGLLTADDLPSGWSLSSIPGSSVDVGPAIPCGDVAMFDPDEMIGTAGARFTKLDGDFRTMQELIVLVDPWSADDGMSYAKIGFPCDAWSDDGGSYHVEQLVVPKIGDDTLAYQYARHSTDGSGDTFADVVLMRQGGLVIEVWVSGGTKYPGVDETVSIARAALERAKSIPQDQEPDPSDPGNTIQAGVRLWRLPGGYQGLNAEITQ